jgi:hypothetical protein
MKTGNLVQAAAAVQRLVLAAIVVLLLALARGTP